MQKHAIQAGMGTPVHPCPETDSAPVGAGLSLLKRPKKETAGHQARTTAAIENQHLDFAAHADATPEAATDAARLSMELIHSGGERLADGNPSECRKAWQQAHKALGAAIDSLDMLLGGQPT
jgi:hypothetical protein